MAEKHMPQWERRKFMRLAGAASILNELMDDGAFETRGVKNFKRDRNMLAKVGLRLVHDVGQTLPADQRKRISEELRREKAYVRVEQIAEDRNAQETDGRWLSHEDINLLYTAASAACVTCSGVDEEYHKCHYRDVFDKISCHEGENNGGKCPYALLL